MPRWQRLGKVWPMVIIVHKREKISHFKGLWRTGGSVWLFQTKLALKPALILNTSKGTVWNLTLFNCWKSAAEEVRSVYFTLLDSLMASFLLRPLLWSDCSLIGGTVSARCPPVLPIKRFQLSTTDAARRLPPLLRTSPTDDIQHAIRRFQRGSLN